MGKSVVMCAALLFVAAPVAVGQSVEVPSWNRNFDAEDVIGAVVIVEPGTGTIRTSDIERSETPYLPASTFKIFSSLMALEAGVVAGADETVPWDGLDRCIAGWNQDLSLRSAYQQSAFWVYQAFSRQIGLERMHRWLQAADYGNQDVGGGVDRYWLDGDLRTSLLDQVSFLERMDEGRLPFSPETIAIVKDVMIEERVRDYVLRGKTGWAQRLSVEGDRLGTCRETVPPGLGPIVTPEIGWYVGYVESDNGVTYFALNIDIRSPSDADKRRTIARRILEDEGLLDSRLR